MIHTEDGEFEKYFEKIEKVFDFFDYLYVTKPEYTEKNYTYTKEERKQKLKEILEEIYQKGHDENVHYQLLKALNPKEAKP